MCGRTALTVSPEELQEAFGLAETPQHVPAFNVPPSRPVHVVRSPARHLEALRWGLVPRWAKDPKMGQRMALARVETLLDSNAFRDAALRRRCLVAVDAFYEWKRGGSKTRGSSQPFAVRQPDGRPFALGGIWDRWLSADGEVIETCAIVTQPSKPPVDGVHDRMPLVIEPSSWDRWLDPALTAPDAVAKLLREVHEPRVALVAYEVSPYVNDPRHDDAACLGPATAAQQSLF
jgi:putative SOS response-associated peptidase YedK